MNNVINVPVINSVQDIQKLLVNVDPNKDLKVTSLDVSTDMAGTVESSKIQQNFAVNAKVTNVTLRSILIESFKSIRNKKEISDSCNDLEELVIGGKSMRRLSPVNLELIDNVDSFIHINFGGYRKEEYVCWDLDDGFTYRYDVFKHQLTRKSNDS